MTLPPAVLIRIATVAKRAKRSRGDLVELILREWLERQAKAQR